jgi:uncharacterized protein
VSDINTIFEEYSRLPVIEEGLRELREKLPSRYCYHSLDHTHDVMREALRLGLHDKLKNEELTLLAIAAAYHDLGYIDGSHEHEKRGAILAAEKMARHGFTPEQIKEVEIMIMATAVFDTAQGPSRTPSTKLSQYLMDADVANLGRGDFLAWADLVRKERNETREAFLPGVLAFMSQHTYYTPAARTLLSEQKARNLAMLKELFSARSG